MKVTRECGESRTFSITTMARGGGSRMVAMAVGFLGSLTVSILAPNLCQGVVAEPETKFDVWQHISSTTR